MNDKDFTAADFLSDDYFREWILSPSEESNLFWAQWIATHPHQKEEIALARQLMADLQQNLQILPPNKAAGIWAAIEAGMDAAETAPLLAVAAGPPETKPQPRINRPAAVLLGLLMACLVFVFYQKNKALFCPPASQDNKEKKETGASAGLNPAPPAPASHQNNFPIT